MSSSSKFLILSNRFYCLLLYLYPIPFRQEYGYHMSQVFRDDLHGTLQEGGWLSVIRLLILSLVDLLKTAIDEHIREFFLMPGEKIKRIGGPALAIGGPMFALGIIWATQEAQTPGQEDMNIVLIFLSSMPLLGFGLFALYKRLPFTFGRVNNFFFGMTLSGLFLYNFGIVITLLAEELTLYALGGLGFGFMVMGITGMGVIVWQEQALERLSFTPILLALIMALMIFVGGATNYTMSIWLNLVLICYALGWFLLGVALWKVPTAPTGRNV